MTTSRPDQRFRPRTLDLGDGGTLLLRGSGEIEHRGPDGATVATWSPGDPEWPRHAIRFGLQETHATVAPTGRYVPGTKPPG